MGTPHLTFRTVCSVVLQVPSESVDRVYVELPDDADSIDDSVLPELVRVLVKGGKITVRYREGAKSFENRLVCAPPRPSGHAPRVLWQY